MERDVFFAVVVDGQILGVSDTSAADARVDALASGHGVRLIPTIQGARLVRGDAPSVGACVVEIDGATFDRYNDDPHGACIMRPSPAKVTPALVFSDCEDCGRIYRPQRGFRPGLCGPCSAVVGLRFQMW